MCAHDYYFHVMKPTPNAVWYQAHFIILSPEIISVDDFNEMTSDKSLQ